MHRQILVRAKCSHCPDGFITVQGHDACAQCRARWRCPICGEMERGKPMGSFCSQCKDVCARIERLFRLTKVRRRDPGDLAYWLELYELRAQHGHPLFGD